MNHNEFPQQPHPPVEAAAHEAPVATEEQARERLVNEIVHSSEIGSVAFYTSAFDHLSPQERTGMRDTIVERQQAPSAEKASISKGLQSISEVSAGWSSYGERNIMEGDDPAAAVLGIGGPGLPAQRDKNQPGSKGAERLVFFDLGDGRVDVRYVLNPQDGYTDASRRSSKLCAGFILPAKEATTLLHATEQDPSVIEDVLKAQAIALGVPEDRWSARGLLPRLKNDGETFHRTRDQRELGISAYGVSGHNEFNGKPEYEQLGEEIVVPGNKKDSLIAVANHEPPEWAEANMTDFDKMLVRLPEEFGAHEDPVEALDELRHRMAFWEEMAQEGMLNQGQLELALKASEPILEGLLLKSNQELDPGWDARTPAEKEAHFTELSRVYQNEAGTILQNNHAKPAGEAQSYLVPLMYAEAFTRLAQAQTEHKIDKKA